MDVFCSALLVLARSLLRKSSPKLQKHAPGACFYGAVHRRFAKHLLHRFLLPAFYPKDNLSTTLALPKAHCDDEFPFVDIVGADTIRPIIRSISDNNTYYDTHHWRMVSAPTAFILFGAGVFCR